MTVIEKENSRLPTAQGQITRHFKPKDIEEETGALFNGNRFKNYLPNNLNQREKISVTALAMAILDEKFKPGMKIAGSEDVTQYLRLKLADRPNEIFGVLYLTTGNRIIRFEELFQGTLDFASVYPRIVVQRVLELNAARVILTHNHPSGISEPSTCDKEITKKLKGALALIDVDVLDHIIVAMKDSCSFSERGLI